MILGMTGGKAIIRLEPVQRLFRSAVVGLNHSRAAIQGDFRHQANAAVYGSGAALAAYWKPRHEEHRLTQQGLLSRADVAARPLH